MADFSHSIGWHAGLLIIGTLLLASCDRDLKEGSDSGPNKILVLDLNYTLDEYVGSNTHAGRIPDNDQYQIRFTVDLFPDNGNGPNPGDRISRTVQTTSNFHTGTNTHRINMVIPKMNLKILVWADFVRVGGQADLHYNTADLTRVKVIDPTAWGDVQKLAFDGVLPFESRSTADATLTRTVDLELAVAYYMIKATDTDIYAAQPNSTPIAQLTTRIDYDLWVPTEYNVNERRVSDSQGDISFTSPASDMAPGSAVLASDIILVSRSAVSGFMMGANYDSSLSIGQFQIHGNNNKLISTVSNVTVELNRGGLTILEGPVLTRPADSGIGVDPTFEGEIPYEFED